MGRPTAPPAVHLGCRLRRRLALGALCVLLACSETGTGPEENANPRPTPENPSDGYVTVAPGVHLHYLDFGGEGDPILLLAGLGNTANVFRDLAPLLADRYRVRALTRRGFGRSSQPSTGYDPATLAHDIVAALDSLGIQKVDLVGHSIAGEEMSRFAVDYPERLGRLVYLDAAYDRTQPSVSVEGGWAKPPQPSAADLATREAFQAYLAGIYGVPFPLAEVVATTVVDANGAVLQSVTPSSINLAIVASVEEPRYGAIAAPALAIYVIPDRPDDIAPWLSPGSAAWDSAQSWIESRMVTGIRLQAARFDSQMANGSVVELEGAKHYVFIDEQSRVATEILAFLSGG